VITKKHNYENIYSGDAFEGERRETERSIHGWIRIKTAGESCNPNNLFHHWDGITRGFCIKDACKFRAREEERAVVQKSERQNEVGL